MALTYRRDIDGLRAVSVLVVLFYHAGLTLFGGGYIGVDVFFVISGYLITSIIVRDIENGSFSIAKFYERRCRRILPALIVVVIASVVAGFLLFGPNELIELGQSAVATSLFSSNFFFYSESDYFDRASELKPLLHTWSLAVEEQYYILFPLLLLFISRKGGRRYALWLISLTFISLMLCIVTSIQNASAVFYLFPGRAWEILLGGLLAIGFIPKPKSQLSRDMASGLGLLLIMYSVFFFTGEASFPGSAALIPVLGATFIIWAGIEGKSFIGRALALRGLVFIGLISYSLYLWHWPILVFSKYYAIVELNILQKSTLFVVVFILSIFSWRYIETPFRRNVFHKNRFMLFTTSAFASLGALIIGLVIMLNNGFPNRFHESFKLVLEQEDTEWLQWHSCENVMERLESNQELCNLGAEDSEASFILWGDSHARALASGVNLSATRNNVSGKIVSQSACPPLLSIELRGRLSCHNYNQAVLNYIASHAEIETVILASRWAYAANGNLFKDDTANIELLDLDAADATGNNAELFEIGLRRTVDAIRKIGREVLLVGQIPEVAYDVPSAFTIATITHRDINSIIATTLDEYRKRTELVDSVFKDLDNEDKVEILSPYASICDQERCSVVKDNTPLYRDDHHLSTFGSKYVSSVFDPYFQR